MRYLNKLVALIWFAQSAFFAWGLLAFGQSIGGSRFITHVGGTLMSGALILCAAASAGFAITLFRNEPRAFLLIVVAGITGYFLSGIFLGIPILQLLMPRIMVVREVIWPFLSAAVVLVVSIPFAKSSALLKIDHVS